MLDQATLDQTTRLVTFSGFLGKTETRSFTELYARKFVIEHIHYDGRYRQQLTRNEAATAYQMCDGFGKLTFAEHERFGFDWSHVRDSSYPTMVEVANWLAQLKWDLPTIAQLADRIYGQAIAAGMDPLLLL